MKKAIRKCIAAACLICMEVTLLLSPVSFAGPPNNYYEYSTNNYNGLLWSGNMANALASPAAYTLEKIISTKNLYYYIDGEENQLTMPMNAPSDLCLGPDGLLYVLDSGMDDSANGRILVIDKDLKTVKKIINSIQIEEELMSFALARGIYITPAGVMYVCFPAKGIIASFTYDSSPDGPFEAPTKLLKVYTAPDVSAVVQDHKNFVFKPTSIVVDRSNRLFVVSEGTVNGLIMLEEDGSFSGFVGANRVTPSVFDLIWRQFLTAEQLEKQKDSVPVEFSSVAIDADGFIYTTSKGNEDGNQMVRKLNLAGGDILARGSLPIEGDISPLVKTGTPGKSSYFTSVALADSGIYACLDSQRARVFGYDAEGNNIFSFGGTQSQEGSFKNPSSVLFYEGKLLVLDKDYGEISVFSLTEYGNRILTAAQNQFNGDFAGAWREWNEVLKMNGNNQFAHLNVGKALYDEGKYEQAMEHFRIGASPMLYSKAFSKIRQQTAEQIMPWIFIALAALILVYFVLFLIRYVKKTKSSVELFFYSAKKYEKIQALKKEGGRK